MTGRLEGLRVLVLRPDHQAAELAGMLRAVGAEPVVVPAIRILPPKSWERVDRALHTLDRYDWAVFTSVNGVQSFTGRASELEIGSGAFPARVGAIGPGTARALERFGLQVDWMPTSFTSATMGEELPDPPARVLLVRADVASRQLDDRLARRGFDVDRVDAYRTEDCGAGGILQAIKESDAVALTSASIAASFARALSSGPGRPLVASIGPATSAACRRLGIHVDVEASEHTMPGLVEALSRHPG